MEACLRSRSRNGRYRRPASWRWLLAATQLEEGGRKKRVNIGEMEEAASSHQPGVVNVWCGGNEG